MLSTFARNTAMDDMFNSGSGFAIAVDPYISLHTADPGLTGANEVAGGSYARQQAVFPASAGGTLDNDANIEFSGMPTADVVAVSVFDAVTAGNCLMTGWLSTVSGLAIVRAGSDVTNNDVQSNAHGFAANDRVVFESVEGLTQPTGITLGTLYHVIATGLTTDAFRVSTTQGGGALDITGAGSAVWRKVVVQSVTAGNIFRIPADQLDAFLE